MSTKQLQSIKQSHKVTDEEFLDALIETNGILTLTAKLIRQKYGISYSRQAAHVRAEKFRAELGEMRESILDYSEAWLVKCLTNEDGDLKVNTKIAMFLLSNLGKKRGYGKNEKGIMTLREQIIKIGNQVLTFQTPVFDTNM